MTNGPAQVSWRDLWAAVQSSALRRLGLPLLRTYLALAIFGVVLVAGSLVATAIGPR